MNPSALARFRAEYGRQRAAEGRRLSAAEFGQLPHLRSGPASRQWRVRARSYERFLARVLEPLAVECDRALAVLDLGAGNGWLCARLAARGHRAVALDLRDDDVDGLNAPQPEPAFARVCASFDALPLGDAGFDLVVFNASLHYALDLARVLGEAARVTRPGGRIAVLDSPFYLREQDGEAMVAEKHRHAAATFGSRAPALLALPFIEFLTPARLRAASRGLDLRWRRHRVRYPFWYEARPWLARARGRRPPSRFDVWEARTT